MERGVTHDGVGIALVSRADLSGEEARLAVRGPDKRARH